MSNQRESQLKPFSLGIVVEDKQDMSDYIKVSPVEELPLLNGSLKDQKFKYEVKLPDAQGQMQESKVQGDTYIIAKWISFGGTNRNSAPDVYASETVQIYRFADTDEYYWTPVFREPKLRKLEKVLHTFSNVKKGVSDAFSKATSYWFEVSTKDKHIQLHTPKNNGEPFEYDIKLDTAKGIFTVQDNVGNIFTLDSSQSTITSQGLKKVIMKDTSGNNFVEVDGDSGSVNVKAVDQINLEAPMVNVKGTLLVNNIPMNVP
jgi:hypothetical protein